MLPNTYQSGSFIELFNAQNKDLVKFSKYSGKITKEFDSGVKGFINVLHSGGLSKMQIPDSDKNSLGIVQSYIVFQVFVFSSKLFNIEVGFTDTSKTKRRLFFSNSSKEIVSNPFHCRVPLLNIPMATWVNISIDVLSFVSECFKASTFRSIDYISITANCKLRRIFSMRNSLNETNKNLISDDLTLDFYELLPKNLTLPQNVNFTNFNFTYEKIRFELDEIKMQDINSGNSVNSTNNFNNVINSNFNNNNNKNTKDSNSNHNLNNDENNNNNRNNNVLSSKRRKLNENGKHESNLKSYKSNLNKLKNFDINSAIGNYNTNNNNNNNQNNNNKMNNNNNENANNQTNGISNFSNNNTNSNGLTTKNARAKSYSRINKFGKNLAANQTNISAGNNENHNVNLNKSPAGEANLLKEKNDLKNHGNNNNNKDENLKKNLFEKNKHKIKYNIPTKINKFLNNKSNNYNSNRNGNGINSKKTEALGSIGSSSAGGKTKADTNNHSEKNKSDNSKMNIKLNKQSNGLSKNNEYDYKSNSLLLNTLNYRNIDKWDNSKDNGGDSIEEIYEIEERNLNGKSMRKYSNSPENYNNNQNAGGVQKPSNNLNNSMNNPDNNLDREENEELEDKFYYDIPIKDFKKKSQFKESGNFFTLNKNKDAEMTPQNQTQNNLNHFYQNNLNTVSNSNKSNYNTNNQFNFSKNTNMNLILNFQNNLSNPNNTNINSNNEGNKDKNKREIIEEILRDTSSGSFFARIDHERPFTPPFTKLVPMNSLEKINSSVIENKEFNNANSINNHNFIDTNVNSSPLLNGDLLNSKLENLHNSQILIANNPLNNSVQLNLNSHIVNANILNSSKIDDIQGLSIKMNPNPNESKMHDISYKIKDINYMDLIYDHVMGHYYDPKSNIYYELKNIGNANKIEIE